jgi:hypothetical protein
MQYKNYKEMVLQSEQLSVVSKHRQVIKDHYAFQLDEEANNAFNKNREIFFLWICGPPEKGKSELAWTIARSQNFGRTKVWQCTDTLKWLDNYTNQRMLLIEEMRLGTTTLQNLLQISDKYLCNRQAKGMYGGANLIHDTMVVTSPYTPQQLFSFHDRTNYDVVHQDENINQLLRRISCIMQYDETNNVYVYRTCGPRGECHPASGQRRLEEFFAKEGIVRPVYQPPELNDPMSQGPLTQLIQLE